MKKFSLAAILLFAPAAYAEQADPIMEAYYSLRMPADSTQGSTYVPTPEQDEEQASTLLHRLNNAL